MKLSRTAIIALGGVLSLLAIGSVAFAQSTSSSSAAVIDPAACSVALDTQTAAEAAAIDVLSSAQKAALQARTNALKAALALMDTAQRQTAIRAAEDVFRQSMGAAMRQYQTDSRNARQAFALSCPGLARSGPKGMHGRGDKEDILSRSGGLLRFKNGMMGGPGGKGWMRGKGRGGQQNDTAGEQQSTPTNSQ